MKIERTLQGKYIWLGLFCLIGILAIVRMFWNIGGDYFTFLDEYQTFDVAAGFAETGKFYFWDFHHQILTDESYTRAWPHTVLLGVWFRLFGINVVSGKVLSAVFGVLFVLSLFYITKRMYENYYISLLSCLFVMTNSTVVTVFRQIRMYSLWMLITLWLIYFIYRALTVKAKEWKISCNLLEKFWRKNFDFSIKYITISGVLLLLGYYTHINTLAIGVGVSFFLLYLLLFKKERRYFTVVIIIALIGLLGALLLPYLARVNSVINNVYWWVVSSGNVALREEKNERYWFWILDFVHDKKFFSFTFACMVVAFLKNIFRRDEKFDFSIYLFLIASSSVGCFVYLLTRYYQARYMLYVAPVVAILMAWGVVESFSAVNTKWMLFLVCLASITTVGTSVKQTFTEVYNNQEICYHKKVYEIVRDDASQKMKDKKIAIAGYEFRDYYGIQVLADYETGAFDRENDMKIWKELSEKYADGYILVESAKINGFPEAMKVFIQNYSEKIAGDGLDHYNIEAVRYHVVNPMPNPLKMDMKNAVQKGPVAYTYFGDGTKTKIILRVNSSIMENNADILFLKFGIFTTDKEMEDKCYQLHLPKQYAEENYYYEIVIEKPCQVALLKDECMIYYNDGMYREKLLYEN